VDDQPEPEPVFVGLLQGAKPSFSITRREAAFSAVQMLTTRSTSSSPNAYSTQARPASVAKPRPCQGTSISQPTSGSSRHER
jgi:hypothetical protein